MRIYTILFIVALLVASLFYHYHKILPMRPWSHHQWRQTDCLSLTLNYCEEGMRFFEPSIHWCGPDGHGKTAGEFPLIYYTVALLWKIVGKHEWIFRLVNITLVFGGLVCLFRLCSSFLKDFFWGAAIAMFVFTSPVLVYYTNNFLPNAPSFGLALMSLWAIYLYWKNKKGKYLYMAWFLFLIAGLVKITALISLVALAGIYVLSRFGLFKKEMNITAPKPVQLFAFLGLIFALIFAWHKYVSYYNSENVPGIFLQKILPIWDMEKEKVTETVNQLAVRQASEFIGLPTLIICMCMLVVSSIFFHKGSKVFIVISWLLLAGTFLYILLWFEPIGIHDYYLTNLLIVLPAICIAFLRGLQAQLPVIFKSKAFKLAAFVLLGFGIYRTSVITGMKYDIVAYKNHPLAVSEETAKYWEWYHYYYNMHFKALEDITPYLRSIGLSRVDKVITIPDQSLNISLYLMDQKGFTDFAYDEYSGSERIKFFQSLGAKYIIVNDQKLLQQDFLQPWLYCKIGQYKNVTILKL